MSPRPRKKLTAKEKRTPAGRFAERLEALLVERGWDSHKLAERIDVGEPAIRKWLRGESLPEVSILEQIGKALDTPEHPFPDYRLILPDPK